MANTKDRLHIYVWGAEGGASNVQDIGAYVENLSISSVAPGGFGTMSGMIRLRRAQIPRPQFGMFARVAMMSRGQAVWLGELMTPAYGINQSYGDYITLNGLGLGNCLRDDPAIWVYSGQTPQQIGQALLTQEVTTTNKITGIISTDNSQIFPDNPALTITTTYDERTVEEVLQDIALQAGDYNWGVEADPVKKDSVGFPLGRIFVRARTLTSIDYMASMLGKDIISAEFTPAATRAYNAIEIDYTNGTSGIAQALSTDARLTGTFGQGTAPFRYRKYVRDMSGDSLVNSTVASSIASTYLNLFKNITYTGTVRLAGVRDGSGKPIPLWEVKAGYNLYLPDLTVVAAAQLPTAATQNSNLFWITSATYHDDANGAQYLELQLGYLPDTADVMVARMQMVEDEEARSGKVTNVVQRQGAALQGYYAFAFSNALLGQGVGIGVTWQALAWQAPTSVTLTPIGNVNVSGLTASNFHAIGCSITGTATAAGAGSATGTYQTSGNCLRHINVEDGRFAHHCDGCDTLHTDRSIADHTYHTAHLGSDAPGFTGLAVPCPACGRIESYNTALIERDEHGEWEFRATQTRLIRQLMSARGMRLA